MEEEESLLDNFSRQIDRRYRTGLVIGRFQPLHYGHIFLMKQALLLAETVIIGIGSSNVVNSDNPYSLERRQDMLAAVLKIEKGIQARVKKIVSLPDIPDDNQWLVETIKRVGNFDLAVGNNDWVNGIFENVDYQVVRTPYYFREIYEGKKIRMKLRKLGML